jgi:hypothetical protein
MPSFEIRYSLFDILRFAVQPGFESGQVNHQETVPIWHSYTRAAPLAKKTASLIRKETLLFHKRQVTPAAQPDLRGF